MKKTVISMLCLMLFLSACTFLFLDFDGSEKLGHNYWQINNYQASFGDAVDIDDIYAVISCPNDSLGEVCIFKTADNDWQEIKTIIATYDELSGNVDVAINNGLLVIGSPSKDIIYTYQLSAGEWNAVDTMSVPGSLSCSGFGHCVDLLDNILVVASEIGPASYFKFYGSEWELILTLNMGENQDEKEHYEFNKPKIRISEHFIVTAKNDDVKVYGRSGDECVFIKEFEPSNNDIYGTSYFGSSIAVDDSCVAVGDHFYNEGIGQVYIYTMKDTGWVEEILTEGYCEFGYALALEDGFMLAGSHGSGLIHSGVAYLYELSENNDGTKYWKKIRSFSESYECGNDVSLSNEHVILSGSSSAYIYKYK